MALEVTKWEYEDCSPFYKDCIGPTIAGQPVHTVYSCSCNLLSAALH